MDTFDLQEARTWQVGVLPYQMALGAELLSLSQVEMPGSAENKLIC